MDAEDRYPTPVHTRAFPRNNQKRKSTAYGYGAGLGMLLGYGAWSGARGNLVLRKVIHLMIDLFRKKAYSII